MPGELIPISLFIMGGLVGIAFSPIGRAISRRLGGEDPVEVKALQEEIELLRQDVAEMRADVLHQLEDTHSRLDFAERVIAQSRAKDALPAGGA
jgi:hypothetical protein